MGMPTGKTLLNHWEDDYYNTGSSIASGQYDVNGEADQPSKLRASILNRPMAPSVPGLKNFKTSHSRTFFLEHPSGRKSVFDLGIRKDYGNYSKSITEYLPATKYDIQVAKNVVDILQEYGIAGSDIEAVIWR